MFFGQHRLSKAKVRRGKVKQGNLVETAPPFPYVLLGEDRLRKSEGEEGEPLTA